MARQKNERLPGIPNGKTIKEVSEAAELYENARDRRMKATEAEVETNGQLVAVMKKHKLKVYKDDDYSPPLIVELTVKDPTAKAKVRREKEAKEQE